MDQPPICDYDGSDYQSSFWDQGGREYEDRVEAIALARLLPTQGKLMLEVGAGAGRNTSRYQNFERIVLLDYSLTQLQQARHRLGGSERYVYIVADAYRMPLATGLFDAATMIRTLHHMADAPRVLGELRRVIQGQGIFILEYANKHNIKAILRFLLGRQTWSPFTLETVEFAELNFDFHPGSIRTWLTQNGFRIEQQLSVSHYRIGILKRLVPVDLLVALDAMVQWTGNWWQLSPSVFVRTRAVGDSPDAPPTSFFRCLDCGSEGLDRVSDNLVCPACGKHWRIQDGIYIFR